MNWILDSFFFFCTNSTTLEPAFLFFGRAPWLAHSSPTRYRTWAPAMKAPSPNHWTSRGFSWPCFLISQRAVEIFTHQLALAFADRVSPQSFQGHLIISSTCFINSSFWYMFSCWLGVPIFMTLSKHVGCLSLSVRTPVSLSLCCPWWLLASCDALPGGVCGPGEGLMLWPLSVCGEASGALAIPAAAPRFISWSDPIPAPLSLCWFGAWNPLPFAPAWQPPPRLVLGWGSLRQCDPENSPPFRSVLDALVGQWPCFLFPRSLIDLVV